MSKVVRGARLSSYLNVILLTSMLMRIDLHQFAKSASRHATQTLYLTAVVPDRHSSIIQG